MMNNSSKRFQQTAAMTALQEATPDESMRCIKRGQVGCSRPPRAPEFEDRQRQRQARRLIGHVARGCRRFLDLGRVAPRDRVEFHHGRIHAIDFQRLLAARGRDRTHDCGRIGHLADHVAHRLAGGADQLPALAHVGP
jgi:hypothetical protein